MKTRLIPRAGRWFKDTLSESNSHLPCLVMQRVVAARSKELKKPITIFFPLCLRGHSCWLDDPSSVASIPVLNGNRDN